MVLPRAKKCRRGAALMLGSVLMGGCTTLASSYEANSDAGRRALSGVPYSLPRARLAFALVRDANGVAIILSQPLLEADPQASYLLNYRPSPTSVDKLKIEVNSQTSFLTAINGEADDKLADILVTAGKTAFGIPESALRGGEELTKGIFDPADPADVARVQDEINLALKQRLLPALRRECQIQRAAARAKRQTTDEEPAVCLAASTPLAPVTLQVSYVPFSFTGARRAACSVGVCTRKANPATLVLSSEGLSFAVEAFAMPNRSDPVPIDLSRAAFAKATHSMTFANGLVTSVDRTKGSELLGLVNVPLDVARGAVSVAAELVQARINLTNNEKTLLNSERDRIKAEEELRETKEALAGSSKPEGALDTLMLTAYLPGLGRGSGAELASGPVLGNEAETNRDAGSATPDIAATGKTKVPASTVLGGQVQGGSDDGKK